jgi:histidinol-phosphate aminotransferase
MKVPIPPHIERLEAYKPGRPIPEVLKQYGLSHAIKLASNENPLGASPKAIEAMISAAHDVAGYPNGGKSLREELAAYYGLKPEQLIAGAGSEGVMDTVMRTFLGPGDEVITSVGTFVGFYVIARTLNVEMRLTSLRNYAYDLEAMLGLITEKTRMIYLANPNNPTGSYFTREEFERFYAQVPENILIIHDEAYYDFAIDDAHDYPSYLTDIRPNLITLRTFSKSHGLAGIRIGFASGPEELILPALKVKLPFEPSTLAQMAGIAALHDDDFLRATIDVNREGKAMLSRSLAELDIRFIDTYANFFCLIFESAEIAKQVTEALERRGVIVRNLAGFMLPECVRLSIGTKEQNLTAIQAIGEVMDEIRLTA